MFLLIKSIYIYVYIISVSIKKHPIHAAISSTWTLKLAQRHERSAQLRDCHAFVLLGRIILGRCDAGVVLRQRNFEEKEIRCEK